MCDLHGERGKHHLVHLFPGHLARLVVRVAHNSSLGLQCVTIEILTSGLTMLPHLLLASVFLISTASADYDFGNDESYILQQLYFYLDF